MVSGQRDGQADGDDLLTSLAAAEQPAEVVGAAGAWLASQLADNGFAWARSVLKLERRLGMRREQIRLQGSKWNRTGELIEFGAVLNVRDGALRKWRRANPSLTRYAGVNDDWVCGHPLGVLAATWGQGQVDLTAAAMRGERLGAFLQLLRAEALPWFDGSAGPELVAGLLPDVTIDLYVVDLAEWLVCRGDKEQAARLVERWLAKDPVRRSEFDAGRSLGERGERPGVSAGRWVTVGWSSAVLRLA
jgi:hypothetical protein